MLRTTTRISHSKSIVELGEPVQGLPEPKLVRNAAKLVMLPGNARVRHPLVEERIKKLGEFGANSDINRMEMRSDAIGVITSGVPYQYVREVLPDASTLKLGMIYPLPMELIKEFASRVKKLYVVEELDPFIEEQVRAAGIDVIGKELLPICGELTPGRILAVFASAGIVGAIHESTLIDVKLPGRPPNMCPGCPHRGVFFALNQLKAYVTGDIGCYTLGFMPPLSAMDTCICMGASIGMAIGVTKVVSEEEQKKVVAVIGDSTFMHTGINGLMDMVYNGVPATVIILDNRITAMTGRQENPASGFTLKDQPASRIDIADLCKAMGVRNVRTIDPYDLAATKDAIKEEMNRPEPSVIVTDRPCVLVKRAGVFTRGPVLTVTEEKCTGCRSCLKIGCPALAWKAVDGKKGKAVIDNLLCSGCDVCRQLCKFEAIERAK
jgi:indolepyruvate ferredoxin oxidoreductase, alpha subunit